MLRVLVVSPGFPVADRPSYTPGIVDTLSMLAERYELVIQSTRPRPPRGVHRYRGLTIRAPSAPAFSRADLVWSLWPNRTGLVALAAATLGRVPLVVSLLGAELAELPELDYRGRGGLTLRAALAGARAITVGSRPLERRLRERLGATNFAREHAGEAATNFATARRTRQVFLAPMGVDTSRLHASRPRAWTPGTPLRLVAVSDLSPVKRVPLLVAALDALIAQGVDATLDIFGDPRGRALPPHPRAKLFGFVSPEDLAGALAGYDALVHASAHESQGFALIEAACARLPIATPNVGVAEELRALGAAVELVDHPAPAALASAALRAASRDQDARDAVRARFDAAPCAARFAAILEEAAAR